MPTTALLLAHFAPIANAPTGIARLRQLILQLAVQGRLVEQDPDDEPANNTLRAVRGSVSPEGDRASRKRKIFTQDKYPPRPDSIPDGWCDCLLEDCLTLINGRAYAQQELLSEGTPVLRIQNLNGGNAWYYSDLELPQEKYCDKGNLLFAWSASFGPYIWDGPKVIYHYHIWKVLPSQALEKQFVYYLLLNLTDQVREHSHGLAMLHMTKAQMEQWPILLPPLAEQRRIVARVDALMALCDALEARQARQGEARRRLLTTLVNALLGARNAGEVTAAWARLSASFALVLDAPEDVAPLRQAVLQLAVQGRLVEQDPEDEPASVLLGRIREERVRLARAGVIGKARTTADVLPSEFPFTIPPTWAWVQLAEVCHDWGQKTPDAPFTYIDVSAIDNERGVISSDVSILQPDEAPSRARKLVRPGTLIYSTVRPYLLNIAIVDREFIPEPIVSTAFAIIHPLNGIYNRYLYYYLRSQPFIDYVAAQMKGVAYPAINDGQFFVGLLPLPSTQEQRRIVARVEQLMALCDALEARLREERTAAARLADGLCAAMATGPTHDRLR